ncbi:hypothetical protein LXA43DRAFT_1103840 [Ganoderma leucocontextum]|nr:hypothetical protein LXA43DRAFT_1103840 [Ganoderma leucocontextum]
MLPSSLFQLLPGVLSLVLSTGSVLADSSGSVPITPILPGSCSKGSKKSACGSNIVGHKTYCRRYMAYCGAKFVGEDSDRVFYNTYCRKGGAFDSCRQYETKGTASTTPSARATSTKSQGNRRGYKSSSDFNIRADTTGNLTTDNLDVNTSNDVWCAVEITLGGANFTVQLDTGSSDL